jgi:hypothetical protein
MKKILLIYLIPVLSGNLKAQETLSPNELNQKLTYFYQNPDSTTLKKIVLSMFENSEVKEKFPPTAVVAFCTSILLSRDPNSIVLGRELKKYASKNQLSAVILSLGNTRDTLVNWPYHSPETNDMMWASYFGTGNSKYLERLVSELQYINREDSLVLFLAGGSAKWSLSSNAKQHETIDRFLRSKLTSAPENLRATLTEILTEEPSTIREEFTARLKEMRKKGLIPAQNQESGEPKLDFVKKEKSGELSINWNDHHALFVIDAKSIKELNQGFFEVEGQIVQFVSVKIPSDISLQNLTVEKAKSALQGYVQYEMHYFQNELKLEISDITSEFVSFNEKIFIKWGFKANVKINGNSNGPILQVYYSTICWDRVVSVNSPIMKKDNQKQIEKRLKSIAQTLTMK